MKQTILITLDAEPNTMKNRLIRLIQNWDLMIKYFKFKSDKDILLYIINVMFKEKGICAT